MAYTEVIPEYLYEFDNYADAEFEYLSLDQYNTLVKIIPQNDADLNSLMNSIRDIIWEYCYVDIEAGAPASGRHVMSIVKILNKHSLNHLNESMGCTSFAIVHCDDVHPTF